VYAISGRRESGWESVPLVRRHIDAHAIRTTSIVPVDLNSLMFHMETTIARGLRRGADSSGVATSSQGGETRGRTNRYLWNEGYVRDYVRRLAKAAADNQTPRCSIRSLPASLARSRARKPEGRAVDSC